MVMSYPFTYNKAKLCTVLLWRVFGEKLHHTDIFGLLKYLSNAMEIVSICGLIEISLEGYCCVVSSSFVTLSDWRENLSVSFP